MAGVFLFLLSAVSFVRTQAASADILIFDAAALCVYFDFLYIRSPAAPCLAIAVADQITAHFSFSANRTYS